MEDPDDVILDTDTFVYIGIGKLLGLQQSAMEEMRKSYQSNTKRKEAYLDTYAHHHPCPSWKRISNALRHHDLDRQADEVENTYVHGMHAHL